MLDNPIYYAGIGSRETPSDMLDCMFNIGRVLGGRGFILRSGAAPGADTAFEQGAIQANAPMQIFLPWPGFNGRQADAGHRIVQDTIILNAAQVIAARFHPNWDACSRGARHLHTRNVFQVLGPDLNTPSDFVICWTKGAKGTGGTGQAIRIAKAYDVPVFDIADEHHRDRLMIALDDLVK